MRQERNAGSQLRSMPGHDLPGALNSTFIVRPRPASDPADIVPVDRRDIVQRASTRPRPADLVDRRPIETAIIVVEPHGMADMLRKKYWKQPDCARIPDHHDRRTGSARDDGVVRAYHAPASCDPRRRETAPRPNRPAAKRGTGLFQQPSSATPASVAMSPPLSFRGRADRRSRIDAPVGMRIGFNGRIEAGDRAARGPM